MTQNEWSNRAAANIAAAISRVRKAEGIRQSDLAERLGCSQQFVSKFEHAQVQITTKCVIKVARAMGVPTERIFQEARNKTEK